MEGRRSTGSAQPPAKATTPVLAGTVSILCNVVQHTNSCGKNHQSLEKENFHHWEILKIFPANAMATLFNTTTKSCGCR